MAMVADGASSVPSIRTLRNGRMDACQRWIGGNTSDVGTDVHFMITSVTTSLPVLADEQRAPFEMARRRDPSH